MVFSRFLSPRLILIHALRDQLDLYVSLESVQLKLKKNSLVCINQAHQQKRGAEIIHKKGEKRAWVDSQTQEPLQWRVILLKIGCFLEKQERIGYNMRRGGELFFCRSLSKKLVSIPNHAPALPACPVVFPLRLHVPCQALSLRIQKQ